MTRGGRAFSYYDILDACQEPGCPICRLGQRAAKRHLDGVIFDSVNDVQLRETLRQSLGYCHAHAWQLPDAGESAPLGIAIIHRDILNSVRQRLADADFAPDRSARARLRSLVEAINLDALPTGTAPDRYLRPTAVCPACERRAEVERLAFVALAEALEEPDEAMLDALRRSDGLCVPHLRRALSTLRTEAAFRSLVDLTRAQLSALIDSLDEYIRKRDHRFREEAISAAEGDSWRRALGRAAGEE